MKSQRVVAQCEPRDPFGGIDQVFPTHSCHRVGIRKPDTHWGREQPEVRHPTILGGRQVSSALACFGRTVVLWYCCHTAMTPLESEMVQFRGFPSGKQHCQAGPRALSGHQNSVQCLFCGSWQIRISKVEDPLSPSVHLVFLPGMPNSA